MAIVEVIEVTVGELASKLWLDKSELAEKGCCFVHAPLGRRGEVRRQVRADAWLARLQVRVVGGSFMGRPNDLYVTVTGELAPL